MSGSLCPSLFLLELYTIHLELVAATVTLPFSPRYFSFSCLREIRCIWKFGSVTTASYLLWNSVTVSTPSCNNLLAAVSALCSLWLSCYRGSRLGAWHCSPQPFTFASQTHSLSAEARCGSFCPTLEASLNFGARASFRPM